MEKKRAILCVDDEVIILLSLIQELKRTFGDKFIYEQAINAEKGFEVIEELESENVVVVIIISDWLMPGMKGDEFLELIHIRYPQIQAIMITGQADQAAINRVKKNSSVVAVFDKPWDPLKLITVISEYTDTL